MCAAQQSTVRSSAASTASDQQTGSPVSFKLDADHNARFIANTCATNACNARGGGEQQNMTDLICPSRAFGGNTEQLCVPA